MAVQFDPQRLAITGTAVPVVEGVLQSPVSGAAQYSFSATGSLVYVPGGVQSNQSKLVWVSRNGAEQPLPAPARVYRGPRVSPEGRRIAMTIQEQESQIWLYDLSRETLTRLTFGGNVNNNPSWTPDGKRIAFESSKEGPLNIFWQFADGTGGLERLTTSEYNQVPHSWSPDGQLLAFIEITPATGYDIWMLRVGDASAPGSGQVRKAQPFLRTRFDEAVPRFSPDGRWLAYLSNETGRDEVYITSFPKVGSKWQVSNGGIRLQDTNGVMDWSADGKHLRYQQGDKLFDVAVRDVGDKLEISAPTELMTLPADSIVIAILPDGKRTLVARSTSDQSSGSLDFVLNWQAHLH